MEMLELGVEIYCHRNMVGLGRMHPISSLFTFVHVLKLSFVNVSLFFSSFSMVCV